MKIIKEECFAYKEKQDANNTPYCNALTELKCDNCSFYKHFKKERNNVFYPGSFASYTEYRRAHKDHFDKENAYKDIGEFIDE